MMRGAVALAPTPFSWSAVSFWASQARRHAARVAVLLSGHAFSADRLCLGTSFGQLQGAVRLLFSLSEYASDFHPLATTARASENTALAPRLAVGASWRACPFTEPFRSPSWLAP